MSIKIMDKVWSDSSQKGSALLLLLAIADHAADDGYCWPSTETLAEKIRMSVRTVYRLVEAIEKDGELYVVRGNRNNRYVVTLGMSDEVLIAVLKARKEDDATCDMLSRDIAMSPTGDIDVTSQVTQLCHPNRHEPSSNRQNTDADASSPSGGDGHRQEPSILENDDPFSMAAACEKAMEGKKPSTVVGPEGRNEWAEAPVSAFCDVFGIRDPPEERITFFAHELERTAHKWRAKPSEVAEAIRAIPKSDHAWRTFAAPRGDTWEDVLGVMVARVRSGETRNVIKIRN